MLGLPSLASAMFSSLTTSLHKLSWEHWSLPHFSAQETVSCCTNPEGAVFPSVKISDLVFMNREEGKKPGFHWQWLKLSIQKLNLFQVTA